MYAEYYHNRIYTSYSFLLGIQNKRSVKYWLNFLIPTLKGAGGREQGAGGRGQRAESREQGAESREQGENNLFYNLEFKALRKLVILLLKDMSSV